MELLSKFEYTLIALLELADQYKEGELLQIQQIAYQKNIPARYLEQLLATLRRGRLIKSVRGAKGGYFLARDPQKITLLDVLICLEGLDKTASVKNNTHQTPESQAIQDIMQEVSGAANSVWQKYTLQDLCERRKARQQTQHMYYI